MLRPVFLACSFVALAAIPFAACGGTTANGVLPSPSAEASHTRQPRDVKGGSASKISLMEPRHASSRWFSKADSKRRAPPQNCTFGASRAAGSSISKYERFSKPNIPATTFVGTLSSALSYVRTVSL